MPVSSLMYKYPSLPLLSPDHLINWLKINYNLTFQFDFPDLNPGKMFMHQMYLPLEARFGSFIIGSILAIKLIQSSNQNHHNKSKTLKKILFFVLIYFHCLTLIQSPVMPPNPPDFVIKLLIGCSRQIFTIGQAFILFSALCPSNHPYHSSWIKKFLSLSIWIPISKLSYFVYLIHWRISFELIFSGYLKFLKTFSITYAALISLSIVLFITEIISSIWFVLADKPIERAIQFYFFNTQRSKNHII
jgi:peptidoglycan/LPS O-acetylase OafA/YrhL